VFYLRDVLAVKRNEEVTGYFGIRPNERNKRDIDLKIRVSLNGQLSKMNDEDHHYTMR